MRCVMDRCVAARELANNSSEQDMRPAIFMRILRGCLRTMSGAEAFCRMRSYLSTARKQGQYTFAAMSLLHEHTPWIPATPALTS